MQHFGTAEVSRLTGIPPQSIRAMVRARYVSPGRGLRGSLRFSFQDVVLLRTARGLLAAHFSRRRIGAALRNVRAQLPSALPSHGLSVTAAGGRVVVHEGGEQSDALSGQLLLAFEVRNDGGKIKLIDLSSQSEDSPARSNGECEQQFRAALELEETDIDAAVAAYRTCVAGYAHSGARTNLGRLLHLQGRINEAVNVYLAVDQPDADILYNLAVALEDLGRRQDAIAAYERVLELDDACADAHHNVARLWQQAGDMRRALRHWNAYRKLSRSSGS